MVKKLLQINVCYNVYSTGKIVEGISRQAIKRGWSSYVAFGRTGKDGSAQTIKVGSKVHSIMHYIEASFFDNAALGRGSYYSTLGLIREIKLINPDIIHIHVVLGYYLNLKVLFDYLKESHKPVVWTLHSCWEFTGHCTHFDYQGCYKWRKECDNCPLVREYPRSLLFDRSRLNYIAKKTLFQGLNNIHFVTVSEWQYKQVSQSFLSHFDVRTIYNGVDLDTFKPFDNCQEIKNKYHLSDRFVVVCAASAWTAKKGLNDYIDISSSLPDDITLLMVGINKRQKSLLPKNIETIDRTTDVYQMVEIYNMADVVLNLSYEETFGLTTIEGLACGTPGVVYDRTASPELVSEGTGFVVKAGDLSRVLSTLLAIKQNGKKFYSNACRKRAEALFDIENNFTKYFDLYEAIMKPAVKELE